MPSDQDIKDGELDLKVTTEDESVDDTQDTGDNGEGESGTVLEDEQQVEKLSPAEENRKKQLEVWSANVASGAKKLEDAPSWVQKELTKPSAVSGDELELKIAKVLAKQQEDLEFKELQSKIPALSPVQAQELRERYRALNGAGKVAALRAAMDAMGLSEKVKEAEERGIAKGRMSLPKSGQPVVRKSEQSVAGVPLNVITNNAEWNKFMKQAVQAAEQ